MRYLSLLMMLFLFSNVLNSQNKEKTDKIEVSLVEPTTLNLKRLKSDQIVSIPIKLNVIANSDTLENYSVGFKVDNTKTTLNSNDYSLVFEKKTLSNVKDLELFIKLKKDSLTDRVRELYLDLKIYKNDSVIEFSNKDNLSLKIVVDPIEQELKGYEYLAYVGTNFDLVEGVRAKDLFFAANIYNAPKEIKGNVGFYLSIYGNRAFTQIDSTGIQRTSISLNPITDTTYSRISTTKFLLTKEVTDNLGTYISPLIKIRAFNPNREKRDLNLYYAPSLEFVYRRTKVTIEDTGKTVIDSIQVTGNINDAVLPNENNAPLFGQVINEFTFNFGVVGVFMSLENENMSIRIHGSVGYSSNYFREIVGGLKSTSIEKKGDVFFSGRAWITESTTGITLQAEVTNLLDEPRPFFVATLSKAFNFKDLGKIFQPIARN